MGLQHFQSSLTRLSDFFVYYNRCFCLTALRVLTGPFHLHSDGFDSFQCVNKTTAPNSSFITFQNISKLFFSWLSLANLAALSLLFRPGLTNNIFYLPDIIIKNLKRKKENCSINVRLFQFSFMRTRLTHWDNCLFAPLLELQQRRKVKPLLCLCI